METNLIVQIGIAVVLVVALWRSQKSSQDGITNVMQTLSKQAKEIKEASKEMPSHEVEERLASVERRMAMLEEDAKTILHRASTRLNRAKKMARDMGDLDDEEETEETPAGQQFRLPFAPQPNGQADNEDDALEAVKAAMRR